MRTQKPTTRCCLASFADGRLGIVTRTVPFDALPDALHAVDRAETVGKLVLDVNEADI